MDQVSIEEARRKLGEIVDRARLAEQPTLITRQGKAAAVVVPADANRVSVDKAALDEFIRYADTLRDGMDMEYGSSGDASRRDFDKMIADLDRTEMWTREKT